MGSGCGIIIARVGAGNPFIRNVTQTHVTLTLLTPSLTIFLLMDSPSASSDVEATVTCKAPSSPAAQLYSRPYSVRTAPSSPPSDSFHTPVHGSTRDESEGMPEVEKWISGHFIHGSIQPLRARIPVKGHWI